MLSRVFTGVLATAAILASAPVSAQQSAYGTGTDGPMLNVNGVMLPRDVVFRFLPVLLPLQSLRVTSLYGLRRHPIRGYTALHAGVDFAAPIGTQVFSTAAGRVTFVGHMGNYGLLVEVGHGLGYSTRYGHLSAVQVTQGQLVDRHQHIGLVGMTGGTTGPHLHFEIRRAGEPMDPITFLLRAHELYRHLG